MKALERENKRMRSENAGLRYKVATQHWSEFDRGGHFPAMEVPDLLVGDVREFLRSLR